MISKWVIKKFDPKDLSKIRIFFKKLYTGMGSYGSIDLFRWKIQENHVTSGIFNLIKDKSKIASTTSLTPKSLFIKGKKEIVAEIGDTYTAKNYQRMGMFSQLVNQTRKDAESKGIKFIYGTPNEQSLVGYEKNANFKIIQKLNVKSMTLPVNISSIISRKTHWIIGYFIGYFFLLFLLIIYWTKKITYNEKSELEITEIDNIPKNWNTFWQKAQLPYDFIFSRDIKNLEWRFIDHPNKYLFYILSYKKEIIGYITCRCLYENGFTDLLIADFLFLEGREKFLKSFLLKILNDSIKKNVSKISVWCPENSPYFKILKDFGFLSRGNIPVICYQNDFSKKVQENCNNWHFTISDSDNI